MKNRFKFFICALLVSFSLVTVANAVKTQFFTKITDLPLISGFVEQEDKSIVFDTPDGRIVETWAIGDIDKEKAIKFYSQTLPQLGWQSIGEGLYLREKELLRLQFFIENKKTLIHITLNPRKN